MVTMQKLKEMHKFFVDEKAKDRRKERKEYAKYVVN